MTKIIFLLLIFISNFVVAQNPDNYNFARIPSRFNFQNEKNQYRINTTLKAFFQQKGFTTFIDDEIFTDAFSESNCNKIYIDLEVKNTFFKTILFVIVKDCKNTILIKSEEGSSRSKELKIAYNEALLMALKSLKNIQFKKSEKQINNPIIENTVSQKTLLIAENFDTKIALKMLIKRTNLVVNLLETSSPTIFIATSGQKNGVVTLINNNYLFEYYSNGKLVSELLEKLP